MNQKLAVLLIAILVFCGQVLSQDGTRRRPAFLRVRLVGINYSEKADLAPVVFEHWIHRSKFTCRVCQVDVGFAMRADATDIKAADNEQ
jgi:hypothetical protein